MTSSIIVADSSPLISLAVIEQLELLPQLYQQVLVPPAVWDEVTIQGAGLPGAEAVRRVNWFSIQSPEVAKAATHFGQIRAELAKLGTPIGSYDKMTAGHVRSTGLILVTNNLKEFTRVAGLRLENWVDGNPTAW